jgi:hypothetical protein
MEPDHRTELESLGPTARCLLTKSGTPGAQPQFGHTRSRVTCSRIAVSENEALSRKGCLR